MKMKCFREVVWVFHEPKKMAKFLGEGIAVASVYAASIELVRTRIGHYELFWSCAV